MINFTPKFVLLCCDNLAKYNKITEDSDQKMDNEKLKCEKCGELFTIENLTKFITTFIAEIARKQEEEYCLTVSNKTVWLL